MELGDKIGKLSSAVEWLEKLVAMDTRNGTGDEVACARFLADILSRRNPDQLVCETVKRSRGKPDSGYVMAAWGKPEIVFNVHLDTVPSGQGWQTDPLTLTKQGDHYVGLGASDIKGAIACILTAMESVDPNNIAVLFSGDEEHGSEVMPEVIRRGHYSNAPMAIVCEPTGCKVGRRHRGIIAFATRFTGPGGHSSRADFTEAPLLKASRLAAAIGNYGDQHKSFGDEPYQGLCTNIGEIGCDGSYNVIPTTADLKFSMRPPPGDDIHQREQDVLAVAADVVPGQKLDQLVSLLPFATRDLEAFKPVFGKHFDPIDLQFWTEAALLADAGVNCVVFGPGDIDTAHRPDEFVSGDHLLTAISVFEQAMKQFA